MKNLSSAQRSHLRSNAHQLEPIVLIGKNGVTDGTLETVNRALNSRELIKIKFREFKDEKKTLSHQIANLTACDVVGMIGHIVILFRQNPDPQKQNIHLPNIK